MKKIRRGNDFVFAWEIERNGLPEDLSSVLEKHLYLSVFGKRVELVEGVDYDITGNVVRIEITPTIANIFGTYKAEFHYILPDIGLIDEDRKCAVDVDAFIIVSSTAQADDPSEFTVTSDMAIAFKGDKGDKGDSFTYADFTPEQIAELQQPATDAIASIQEVELAVETAEGLRVQAELNRQTNTSTAILNAEQATDDANNAAILANEKAGLAATATTEANTARDEANLAATAANTAAGLANDAADAANTAAGLADTARLAIQDDLALKANHGYASSPKTLKQVDDSLIQLADDVNLKEVKANKQNSLAPDGTGTKFPTVDAVNAGLASANNLLVKYEYNSNKVIQPTSLDPVTGIFTCANHGLATNNHMCFNVNDNHNLLPYQVIPIEINGGEYGRYYVEVVDINSFKIKKTTTGIPLTYASAGDITKWHFETNMTVQFTITNIPSFKRLRVVCNIKANQQPWVLAYPSNINGNSNIWYSDGSISNLYSSTYSVNGASSVNLPTYVECEFHFDKISTVRYSIYGMRNLHTSPSTVTRLTPQFVNSINFENLGQLTITDMVIGSPSRYILNGTTVEIYKL